MRLRVFRSLALLSGGAMRVWRYCALLLVPVVVCLVTPPVVWADGPVVTCDPVVARGEPTQDLSVDIRVNGVTALYGVDISATFDPAIAHVVDANTRKSGVQIQPLATFFSPDFVARDAADNSAGTFRYAATQVAPSQPVSGSGSVFRVTFHPLTSGVFRVAFTLHELVDVDGMVIPSTALTCTVEFQTPLAVELADVEVQLIGDGVQLEWETVSEVDNTGFNVYRQSSVQREAELIVFVPAAAPGSTVGHRYTVRIHPTYEADAFWLEAVALSGPSTRSGPYSAVATVPNALALTRFEGTRDAHSPVLALSAGAIVAVLLLAVTRQQLSCSHVWRRQHATGSIHQPSSTAAGVLDERVKGG